MNILVITQMYSQPDDVGDNKPTKTVNYFVKEWVELGHRVIVIHCATKFPFIYYCIPKLIRNYIINLTSCIIPPLKSRKKLIREENGAIIYRLPMRKMIPGQSFNMRQLNKQHDAIITILKEKAFIPNVVVGHFANPSALLVASISEKYKAASSIVFHGDCSEKTIEKYGLVNAASRIKAIGARSIIEAERIEHLLKLKKTPFVCCSGVPNDVIQRAPLRCTKHNDNSAMIFLYVGSFIKRKHVDAVIKAFDMVQKNQSDILELIGGGIEEKELKVCARKTGKQDMIHFLGRIPREDVFIHMQKAHIFALISDEEVYGMVYIEAMLHGCIVIASKGEGFDGIIQNGINGFLCDPGNAEMLAQIFARIQRMNVAERNKIGQAAIETAKHYSEKEVAEKYLNDILSNQGAY